MTNVDDIHSGLYSSRRLARRLLITLAVASLAPGCSKDPVGGSEETEGPSSTESSSGSSLSEGNSESSTTTGSESSGELTSTTAVDTSTGEGELFAPPQETWRAQLGGTRVHAICVHSNDDIMVVSSNADTITEGAAFIERVSSDGDLLWTTQYEAAESVYLYEVACGSDGSVYAVGHVGDDFYTPDPLLVRFDPNTGLEMWSQRIEAPFSDENFMGVSADEDGVYVAGSRGLSGTIAHYDPDGTQDWGTFDGAGFVREVHAVHRWGDQLIVAGFGEENDDELGWVAAFGLDGELRWSEKVGEGDMRASILLPSPGGENILVAGQSGGSFDAELWVLTCDPDGCESSPQWLDATGPLEGFAVDARGHWLTARRGLIRAHVPGAESAWSYDTETHSPFTPQDSVLATDSQGAILLGGVDRAAGGPVLIKLALPDE